MMMNQVMILVMMYLLLNEQVKANMNKFVCILLQLNFIIFYLNILCKKMKTLLSYIPKTIDLYKILKCKILCTPESNNEGLNSLISDICQVINLYKQRFKNKNIADFQFEAKFTTNFVKHERQFKIKMRQEILHGITKKTRNTSVMIFSKINNAQFLFNIGVQVQ